MRTRNRRTLELPFPPWANRLYRGLGLAALLNGVVRYTFVGEFVERYVDEIALDLQAGEPAQQPIESGSAQVTMRTAE
jgi:hypothetical protein